MPALRREIESGLFQGRISAVVATNALELGIDVGDLDVTLHVGFPYSLSSFWQQAGRGGRRRGHSVAILIVDGASDPVGTYYATHPEELMAREFPEALIDITSEALVSFHLQCAAEEMPVNSVQDQRWFQGDLESICDTYLSRQSDGKYRCHRSFSPHPAQHMSIRGTGADQDDIMIQLVDVQTKKVLEELEPQRALFHVYEGAVYFHEGKSYVVQYVDFQGDGKALLKRQDVDYITKQRDYTDVDGVTVFASTGVQSGQVCSYGEVRSTSIISLLHSEKSDCSHFHGVWVPQIRS